MTPNSLDEPANDAADAMHAGVEVTAMQEAIRKRAIDTVNAEQARPPASLPQRMLILGLTLSAMLVFVLLINFVVTGMQKIMDVWYPGSISGRSANEPMAVPPLGPDQPFYISVDPPADVPHAGDAELPAEAGANMSP
jgi:hypothetical protein